MPRTELLSPRCCSLHLPSPVVPSQSPPLLSSILLIISSSSPSTHHPVIFAPKPYLLQSDCSLLRPHPISIVPNRSIDLLSMSFLYNSNNKCLHTPAIACAKPQRTMISAPYSRALATISRLCSSDLSGPVGAELFFGAEM